MKLSATTMVLSSMGIPLTFATKSGPQETARYVLKNTQDKPSNVLKDTPVTFERIRDGLRVPQNEKGTQFVMDKFERGELHEDFARQMAKAAKAKSMFPSLFGQKSKPKTAGGQESFDQAGNAASSHHVSDGFLPGQSRVPRAENQHPDVQASSDGHSDSELPVVTLRHRADARPVKSILASSEPNRKANLERRVRFSDQPPTEHPQSVEGPLTGQSLDPAEV